MVDLKLGVPKKKGILSFLATRKIQPHALCYHSVNDVPPFPSKIHCISPKIFSQQIDNLYKKRIKVLPLAEYLEEKEKRNSHLITAITFDDGYKDVFTVAFPILKERELPFTIFLSSKILQGKVFWRDKIRQIINQECIWDFKLFLATHSKRLESKILWDNFYRSTKLPEINSIQLEKQLDKYYTHKGWKQTNQKLYLTIEELALMVKEGVTIGNHTHNHYYLSSLSKKEQELEIETCHKILKKIGVPFFPYFGIPFGGLKTFNQDTLDIIKDLGFKGFVMTNSQHLGRKKPIIPYNTLGMTYTNRFLPPNKSFAT